MEDMTKDIFFEMANGLLKDIHAALTEVEIAMEMADEPGIGSYIALAENSVRNAIYCIKGHLTTEESVQRFVLDMNKIAQEWSRLVREMSTTDLQAAIALIKDIENNQEPH